jgi:hypothetical protein
MTETAPTWPHERPTYTSLAAAVQGEAARWNVPGMTAAVLHDDSREAATVGSYARHDAVYDIARIDGHIRIARHTIEPEDQFSHERHADDPPVEMAAWPTGEGLYLVLEGPFRDTLVEFFQTRLFTGEGDALASRPVLRTSGRLAERR